MLSSLGKTPTIVQKSIRFARSRRSVLYRRSNKAMSSSTWKCLAFNLCVVIAATTIYTNLSSMLKNEDKSVEVATFEECPALPQIRDRPAPESHVDVVISWHCDCESIDWLSDVSPELSSVTTIILLHKIDEADLSEPECSLNIPETNLEVISVRLPTNIGRDSHSPFAYISNHYENLASFTVFMQAGYHWTVGNGWVPSAFAARGFKSNAEVLNYFVPEVIETKPRFLPIMPMIDGQPILFVNRDHNDNKEEQDRDDPPTLRKFDASAHDIANRYVFIWFEIFSCYSVISDLSVSITLLPLQGAGNTSSIVWFFSLFL